MKYYHNIETRKFPGDTYYVAYGKAGNVWRVSGKSGYWRCVPQRGPGFFIASTLAEVSEELTKRV